MRNIIIITVLVIAVFALYLNLSYAHVFSSISERDLVNPTILLTSYVPPISPTTTKITYVALGDSLTAGVGATSEQTSYPYIIARLMAQDRKTGVTVVNLGEPGASSIDVLKRQAPQVAALHPDVVTLVIGINDMFNKVPAEVFEKNIISIVDSLASTTKYINIINIPYIGNTKTFLPPYRYYFDWQIRGYNNLLNNALIDKHIPIIDLYTLTHEQAFTSNTYYSADGFHPSDESYKSWGKIIYDNLNY